MNEPVVAVLGEALIDLVACGGDVYRAHAGGSGFNTAIGLARLGVGTAYCGSLSRDAQGRRLAADLGRDGVDQTGVLASDAPAPIVLVETDTEGQPHYSLHLAGTTLDEAPGAWRLPPAALHAHATSFASTLGAAGAAALSTLAQARGRLTTSFDPNVRPAILPGRAATLALLAARVAMADVVKVSAEDLVFLTGAEDGEALIAEWLGLGVRLLVRTEGARGATAFVDGRAICVPARPIDVRDTVGAGDSFMAALLACLAREGRLGQENFSASPEDAARWLTFASRAAAVTCQRAGADPPRLADLG